MVQFKGAFLHRDDLRDATARIDKGRIQINQGVFHPHGGGTRCGKNKEHAVIGRKIGAVHQTGAVFNRGARDFEFDNLVADLNGNGFIKCLCCKRTADERESQTEKKTRHDEQRRKGKTP